MSLSRAFALAVCISTGIVSAADKPYPRPELLVEPSELPKPGAVVILDARERPKYDAGHVPGAVWVDHAAWAKAFGDGTDAAGWGERIGALGITPTTRVVAYDDNFSREAARVWWVLRYWGVADVRVFNGGWKAWTADGRPVETATMTPTAVPFEAKPRRDRLATKESLLRSLDGRTLQIVDARSEGEYCGTDKLTNKRAGAVPGAVQLEWIDLIDKSTHRFKSADELAALFAAAGIKHDRPTATHCQSGGRASVMAFGLELMGATDVSNYYKSWSEWGNADDTPVVTPPPKGKK
jgi:thiosulfate/3-mercaptopyruvate sulfurtransferase